MNIYERDMCMFQSSDGVTNKYSEISTNINAYIQPKRFFFLEKRYIVVILYITSIPVHISATSGAYLFKSRLYDVYMFP